MEEVAIEEISAEFARQWWKSLLANAVALLEDAALLGGNQSPGRAQALLVLAIEELAKARWLLADHTRQQDCVDPSLIDSAEDLHWAVMPYSDPELIADS